MSTLKIGRSHRARKALFARGIRRGYLLVGEIDEALPPGSLTDAERWLLFYSLQAARVEVRDKDGKPLEPLARLPEPGAEIPRGASLPPGVETRRAAELQQEAQAPPTSGVRRDAEQGSNPQAQRDAQPRTARLIGGQSGARPSASAGTHETQQLPKSVGEDDDRPTSPLDDLAQPVTFRGN